MYSILQVLLLPSLLKTLTALTSIWAPTDSPGPPPAAPVLLLTLGLAIVSLSWALGLVLVVTRLSWVSAGEGDVTTPWFVAGSLPSLWSTLRLAGGRPLGAAEVEEEVGVSEGGDLNLLPRRRRVVRAGFVAGCFFCVAIGFLRTPAYWRTEPSLSLSNPSSTSMFPAILPGAALNCSSTPLSRRLNTPVGCQTWVLWAQTYCCATTQANPIRHTENFHDELIGLTLVLLVVVSAFDSAPSLSNTDVRFKPF